MRGRGRRGRGKATDAEKLAEDETTTIEEARIYFPIVWI